MLSKDAIDLLKQQRYYVFFPDGTWRTVSEKGDEWKSEQLYKLNPTDTGWVGGDFLIKVLNAVIERTTDVKP